MKFELLPEPKLEFGDNFICEDPKKGISVGGFFSLTNQNHRSEIRVSIIGTKNNIQDFKDWLTKLSEYTEATAKTFKLDNEASIHDGEIASNDELEDPEDLITELFPDLERNQTGSIEYAINKKLNPDFIGFNKGSSFRCEFLNDELNNIEIKSVQIDAILLSDCTLVEKRDQIIGIYKSAFQSHIDNLNTKPDVA
jgi:hypothetical protein